jgi:hypothetical protein
MQIVESWQGVVPMVIFIAAIAGGALTAFVRLTDRDTPIDIGLLHGRMGAAGVVFLVVMTVSGEVVSTSVKPAIVLFALTVVAGAALYYIIRRKGILPKAIIFAHGAFAVCALAVLLFGLPF